MPIILKDGTEYDLSREELDFFKNAYPEIDVYRELKKMEAWCFSNPQKRKTRRGIRKFINCWLNRSLSASQPVKQPQKVSASAYAMARPPSHAGVVVNEDKKREALAEAKSKLKGVRV